MTNTAETTYKHLDKEAREIDARRLGHEFKWKIEGLLMSAADNAADTPDKEFYQVAHDSLGVLLSDERDVAVTAWFKARGLVW